MSHQSSAVPSPINFKFALFYIVSEVKNLKHSLIKSLWNMNDRRRRLYLQASENSSSLGVHVTVLLHSKIVITK